MEGPPVRHNVPRQYPRCVLHICVVAIRSTHGSTILLVNLDHGLRLSRTYPSIAMSSKTLIAESCVYTYIVKGGKIRRNRYPCWAHNNRNGVGDIAIFTTRMLLALTCTP